MPVTTETLQDVIRDVPDFPKKGIVFKDITPLMQNAEIWRYCVDQITEQLKKKKIDVVVGIESRGFLFGPAVAYKLNVGFVPVRKKGKLPWKTHEVSYDLEYGSETIQIHQDALKQGDHVAVLDDLLATGGTADAAARLVEKLGGKVELFAFLVELGFLKGRDKLSSYDCFSLIQY